MTFGLSILQILHVFSTRLYACMSMFHNASIVCTNGCRLYCFRLFCEILNILWREHGDKTINFVVYCTLSSFNFEKTVSLEAALVSFDLIVAFLLIIVDY